MRERTAEALRTARGCRHYAMCKIDSLKTGVCPSGRKNHLVSFYPQGLMDITAAFLEKRIPFTPGLLHVTSECTMCGICDLQCHFVTGLRPLKAIIELKELVRDMVERGIDPEPVAEDEFLKELRKITGQEFSTSDPAHLAAYSNDPCPTSVETVPRYITLPLNTQQTSRIVRLCGERKVPFSVRGNGSSVMGFVLSPGVVIDTARMRSITFDTGSRAVTVGAGISSMELQREARKLGFRVNTAEPAALYCANLMCSGIFSLFSSSLGTGLDNVLDAEFVLKDGEVATLSREGGPNPCAFSSAGAPPPGICTRAVARLYPVSGAESAIAVPFQTMSRAVEYARELNTLGIGLGTGVLGTEYLGSFLSPTAELADTMRRLFRDDLEMPYMVLVLGASHDLEAAEKLAPCVLRQDIMTALTLGMNAIEESGIGSIIHGLESDEPAYAALAEPGMAALVEAALQPSAESIASSVPADLESSYRELYERPEMTDMLWLNDFRVISSRMGRQGHVVAFILYVPLEDPELAEKVDAEFAVIAEKHGIRGEFGFLTPLDHGSMGVFEWDMYLDHTDDEEVIRGRRAMEETVGMMNGLARLNDRILWIGNVFNQGFCRKESFLHHRALIKDEG